MLFDDMQKYRFNTKCKVYPHGETNITYCSYKIFPDKELKEKLGIENKRKKIKQTEIEHFLIEYPHDFNAPYEEIIIGGNVFVPCSLTDIFPNAPVETQIKPKKERGDRKDSMKRSIDSVYDIAYCNDWNYFLTITINPEQIDSYDVVEVMLKLRNWLNNQVKRKDLKYLLIPEYHKSGRIHAHALINNALSLSDSGHKLHDGRVVYNVDDWKYGFTTAISVDDNKERLSRYLLKYISKGNDKIFGKYFWSSKNLVRTPQTIFLNTDIDKVDGDIFKPAGMDICFKYEAYFAQNSCDEVLKYLAEKGAKLD